MQFKYNIGKYKIVVFVLVYEIIGKRIFDRRGHFGNPKQGTENSVPFLFVGEKMNKYLEAQSKTNEIIINGLVRKDELERFATADARWIDSKKKEYQHRTIKKGEIYQFEFGKNYASEMSYEHRGLVIGVKKKMVYVLPIFSYNKDKHKDIYHPIDSPDSKSDMFLLKNSDYAFIKHDSILKLNDMRSVSINRILYRHAGRIDPTSNVYKSIEILIIQKYFAQFYYQLQQSEKEIERLKSIVEQLEKDTGDWQSEK